MKIDIKGIKKIHSDEDVTTLQHPDGHEIKVAHKALSKKMRSQLEKLPGYAGGGEVMKDQYNIRAAGEIPFTANPALMGSDMLADEQLPKLFSGEQAPEQFSPGAWKQAEKDVDIQNYVDAQSAAQKEQDAISARQKAIEENDVRARAGVAPAPIPEAPVPQQSTPVVGPAPASIAPPAAAAPAMPAIPSIDTASMMKQYEQGAQKEAIATGELGKKEAALHEQQAGEIAKAQETYAQNSEKLTSEYNAVMADYKAQHINPNHYMESMSSGQKVRTAIGMLMAGLGGGENQVSKFLDDQIKRDVDAQEKNMGKTENLMKFNMQQFGNLKDATTMTLAMTKGLYAEKLEQAASLSKDPIAKARALQAAAKFKADALPFIQKVVASQTANSILNSGENTEKSFQSKINALQSVNPEAAKNAQEMYIPGVGIASVKPVDKDRETLATAKQIKDGIMQLQDRAKRIGTTLPGSKEDRTNKTLVAAIQLQMKNAYQLGVLSQSDLDMLNKLVADPGSIWTSRAVQQMESTKQSMNSIEQGIIKKLGVKPFADVQQASSNQQSMEGMTASDGKGNRIIMRNGKWVPYGK